MKKNTQVLLAARPQGAVKASDFRIDMNELPKLQAGQLLIRNHFISLDPAMRGWMNAGTTYVRGVEIGEVMRAFTVGIVEVSKHPAFQPGDAVQGLLGVQEYAVSNGEHLLPAAGKQFPLSWSIGALGMPGLTAYFGLLDKGQPKAGETVLVSGAAGMVGSFVGQIAKLKGCKVIGIAGGAVKCRYLTEVLGFDSAIDYKNEDLHAALKTLAPEGVHIYFDNVGGEILDKALLHLAFGARVVLCGAISQYNEASYGGLKNYLKLVTARGTMSGIIVLDYFPRAAEAIRDLTQWLNDGSLQYKEHIVEGIEQFPAALNMLFTGENFGKLVLKIS
jgi:NADPH-dependent curcumin reductase CurA